MTNNKGQAHIRVVEVEAYRVFTQSDYYKLIDELMDEGATEEDIRDMGWDTYEGWVHGITGGRNPWPVATVHAEHLNEVVSDLNNYHNKEAL